LDWISTTLISFAYSFVIWKTLSPADYGIITTSINLMMILGGIGLLGMGTAVQKLIAEYLVKNKRGNIGQLIRMSFITFLIIDLVVSAILLSNRSFFASALKINENVIWLICIGIFIFSFYSISSNILYGFQNMKGYFKTDVTGNLLKFIVSTLLILLGFSYFGPLIGFLICFTVIPLLRLKPSWFHSGTGIDKKYIMMEYSLPAFVFILATLVFNYSHYIILTVIKNPEVTGLFSLAMVIASLVSLIPTIITQAIFPIMSQLSVKKNSKMKQVKLINAALRYSLLFAIPFSIALTIMLKPLILFLKIKTEYLPAVQYLPIASLGWIFIGCASIFSNNLYAIGKTKINRNIAILTTVLFLVTSIPMTYYFSAYGLVSAFLAVGIVQFFTSYHYMKKFLNFKLPLADVGKILFSSVIFILLLYFGEKYLASFVLKVMLVFIAAIIYGAVLSRLLKFFNGQDIFIIRSVSSNLPKPIRNITDRLIEKFL
jgi:O-antigen/teichoic acid export membrane protein